MLIEIDGQQYDVPDNATPQHIQKSLGLKAPTQDNAPQESTGWSGLASDALAKGLQAAFSIPGAVLNAPGEIYGAGEQVLTNPKRAAQNVGAGLGELGHGILSGFGNLRDYLVKKQIVTPESHSWRLPESVLPKEFDYGQAVGRKGEQAGDTLLESIPGLAISSPFSKALGAALKEIPLTKKMAAKPFVEARKLVSERDIKDIKIPSNLIKEAKDYLPNNKSTKELIKKASEGDYKSLFTLQSDVGKTSRELTHPLSRGADRLRGIEAGKLKTKIMDSMKEHLAKNGHLDISELLTKGQSKYRSHMKYKKAGGYLLGSALLGTPAAKLAYKAYNLVD